MPRIDTQQNYRVGVTSWIDRARRKQGDAPDMVRVHV